MMGMTVMPPSQMGKDTLGKTGKKGHKGKTPKIGIKKFREDKALLSCQIIPCKKIQTWYSSPMGDMKIPKDHSAPNSKDAILEAS